MNINKKRKVILTILALVVVLFALTACTSAANDLDVLEDRLSEENLNPISKVVAALYDAVGNYGWTMVLVTVILKVLMLPLDIWQKVATKKSSIQMQEMAPLIAAIDKKYAADPQKANAEKSKIYKKQGYSLTSSCLPLLATMFVFFVVFAGVNDYAKYRNYHDYEELYTKYEEFYEQSEGNKEQAQQLTYEYYDTELRESWLWIKSIWRPDTWEQTMSDFTGFAQSIGLNARSSNVSIGDYKNKYEVIFEAIVTKGYDGWNGYLILPVLCVGLSFLSMAIPQIQAKKKGEESATPGQQGATNKVMMFMMPAMMAYFGFIYTGAFAIYITCNYALNLVTNLILTKPVEIWAQKSVDKARTKNGVEEKASYKR